MTKANVTHPELKTTFQLPILGVKKNPQSPLYTSLGVLTKGTIVEVNVSELGMVTTGGKVVWSSKSWLQVAAAGIMGSLKGEGRKMVLSKRSEACTSSPSRPPLEPIVPRLASTCSSQLSSR